MKTKSLLSLLTLALLALPLRAEFRTWTSTVGTTTEAELVDRDPTTVTLRLKDGRTIKIERNKLSADNQALIPEEVGIITRFGIKNENPDEGTSVEILDFQNNTYRVRDSNGRILIIPREKVLSYGGEGNASTPGCGSARNAASTSSTYFNVEECSDAELDEAVIGQSELNM